jgi:hypothetical protein
MRSAMMEILSMAMDATNTAKLSQDGAAALLELPRQAFVSQFAVTN